MAEFVISSGHAKYVAGANCYIDEVTEARKVVDRVVKLLNNSGHDTIKYHDNTTKNPRDNVNGIVAYHNSKSRNIDVSVHFNAFKKTKDEMGVEVLYVSNSGKEIAEKVVNAIAKASGLKNRGAKKRTNLGFLNGTNKPAILIEVCFVDSKADVEIYKNKFEVICEAIAEALTGNKVKKAPKTKVKSSTTKKQNKANLKVDGYWGNETTKALQKALRTPVDGEIWGQYRTSTTKQITSGMKYGPAYTGSKVIKALQKKIGAKADGLLGKETVRELQKYLGTPADGELWKPSRVVKELQRRLNAGTF